MAKATPLKGQQRCHQSALEMLTDCSLLSTEMTSNAKNYTERKEEFSSSDKERLD